MKKEVTQVYTAKTEAEVRAMFKAIRKAQCLSQSDVSQMFGKSYNNVWGWRLENVPGELSVSVLLHFLKTVGFNVQIRATMSFEEVMNQMD